MYYYLESDGDTCRTYQPLLLDQIGGSLHDALMPRALIDREAQGRDMYEYSMYAYGVQQIYQ